MAADDHPFHLAALVHSLGRRRARDALVEAGDARRAFERVRRPAWRPQDLETHCSRFGLALLTARDSAFPPLLCEIPDPPLVLYALGELGSLFQPAVAVVGARRCSYAGAEVATAIAHALAARGVVVISGLALGIDTAAHRGALAAGRTSAVIGSGLARPYPSANRGLVKAIVESGGLLLSEYPPLAGARRHHFPERNRLISGLAHGVVVVEAGESSGSLITARLALEQGREVCAVPGNVGNPVARGCHRLLRQGAALVETGDDVIDTLGLADRLALRIDRGELPPTTRAAPAQPDAAQLAAGLAALLDRVDASLTTLDQIVACTGLSGSAAAAALVELELAGFVRRVPGGYIRRPLR